MDEIRCQMCGKENPADAEVSFCQARLKPVGHQTIGKFF
jgi:hypothetical protein